MSSNKMVYNLFDLGDRVHLDHDESLVATVICMSYNGCWSFECAWFVNGDHKTAWFAAWRLSVAPGEQAEPDYPKLNEVNDGASGE